MSEIISKKKIDLGDTIKDILTDKKLVLNRPISTRFNRRLGPVYHSDKPSMTQQQYANECDLNNLVDKNMRFKDPAFLTKLQMFGSGEKVEPIYGDFASVSDFQGAMNTINTAIDHFMSLPSKIRARFDNDPVKLLSFVNDERNYEEGLALGIYKPRETYQDIPDSVEGGNTIVEGVTTTPQPEGAGSDAVSA